jgi:hypothetical protein
MIKYVFREDEPLCIKAAGKADAQTIGESLAEIAAKGGDKLKPEAVVFEARRKSHPLHRHFEWDDEVAAESYRVDQARNLIRIVRVIDEDAHEGTSRAFVSISTKTGTAYHTIEKVKSSADLQLAVMQQADRDLEAFQRRYRELVDICTVVASARDKLREKRAKLESRAAP